jgi:FK506-binding protein 1
MGMAVGDSKKVTLEPADAYGERDPTAVVEVPLAQLPQGVTAGMRLRTGEGRTAIVTRVEGDKATVDLNNEMAGKTLTFSLTLVSCAPKPVLVLEDISPGDGRTFPRRGDRLQMHYTGKLKDGTVFDSSVGRGPFEFHIGLGEVIEGWDEGVLKMSLGQKARLHVPSAMGYGAQGAGGVIPPNADLVFDVELLKISPSGQGHGHSHGGHGHSHGGVPCDGNH